MRAGLTYTLALACSLALLAAPLAAGARSYAALRTPLALPADGLVRQTRPNSCGAALLATLLTRAGRPASEAELIRQASPGPQGITLHAFAQLARSRRLRGAWFAAPQALSSLTPPYVAHLNAPTGHYVWIRGRVGPFLRVSDPATGEALHHVDALGSRFSGRVFRLEDDPEAERRRPLRRGT